MSDQEFGFTVKSSGGAAAAADVRAPREEVDKFAESAAKLGITVEQLRARLDAYNGSGEKTKQSTKDQTAETAKLEGELQTLIGRLDPAQRAILQMADAQGLLARSQELGLISAQQQQELAQRIPDAFAKAEDGANRSAFATAGARRELIVLGHEAVTGNFSRMPGSFMVFAERVGASGTALIGFIGVIAAVAISAAVMMKAISDGHKEMDAMNNALAITSNYAGMTRGNMEDVAASVSATGAITVGTAKEIVTAIVASGRYSADNVALLASITDNYAHATGQSADKANAQLVKMFEDPTKASETLNQQYHYLSVAELDRIRTLQQSGQVQEAVTASLTKFSGQAPEYVNNLGIIEKGWIAIKKAISSVGDALGELGKKSTPEVLLAAAMQTLANLNRDLGPNSPQVKYQEAYVKSLQDQVAGNNALAKAAGEAAQKLELQHDIQKQIDSSGVGRIKALTNERDKITATNDDGTPVVADSASKRQKVLEIDRQIRDIRIQMGAEGAAMANSQIDATLKLRELSISMAQEANDSALRMKTINQEEHDKTKTALDLQKNAMEQIAVIDKLAVGNMTEGARLTLNLKLQELKADQEKIGFSGGLKQSEDVKAAADEQAKLLNGMVDDINKVGDAETKRLTEAIAAQQLHNAEIGKTKAQIDLVKQADQDATTAKLQGSADAISAMLAEQAGNQALIDIYQPMLVQLNAQIEARRKLSGLMGDAAVLQRDADAATQYQRDWKHANDEISRALTDGLMRGFEKGKTIAQNFRDTLLNMFKTLILQPVISFLVQPISGAFTAAMTGMGLGGTTAGGFGSGLSMASGANTVSGWFGGPSIGPGSLGGMFAGITTPGMTTSALAGADMALGGLGGAEGAAGLAAGGLEAGGALAGASGALAAMGPIGWAALAAIAAMAIFGGDSGPKASDASLRRRSDGSFGIEMNNVAGGDPDMNQVLALNAALNDPTKYDPAKLAGLVGTQVGTGSPADTGALLGLLTQNLQGAADSAQALTAATAAMTQADKDAATSLTNMQDKVNGFKTAAAQTAEALSKSLQDISQAYFSAQDDVAQAQQRIDDLNGQAADSLRAFAATVQDFLQSLNTSDIATASPSSQYAALKDELSTTAAAAFADPAMQAKLTDVATRYLAAAKAEAPDLRSFALDEANVRTLLAGVADTAQASAGATIAAVDPMVEAQQDLLKAQQHLADIFEAVKATGASTDRSAQDIAGSAADLLTAFNAAKAADDQAQSDYRNAQALTAGIEFTVADNLAGLRADLATYNAAIAISGPTGKYNAAKATSDALLSAQAAYVASIGGSVYTPENIAANQAQMFSIQYSSQAQLDTFNALGAAYGSAFTTAQALYAALPGHADGMPYIPRDNYAMRGHLGEAVVDAQSMAAFRKYGIPAGGGNSSPELIAEIRDLRAAVEKLHKPMENTSKYVQRTSKTLTRVTLNGEALVTTTG